MSRAQSSLQSDSAHTNVSSPRTVLPLVDDSQQLKRRVVCEPPLPMPTPPLVNTLAMQHLQ